MSSAPTFAQLAKKRLRRDLKTDKEWQEKPEYYKEVRHELIKQHRLSLARIDICKRRRRQCLTTT